MKFNNMNRYIIAFWMLLTMSALCLAGLTYIASDLFQIVALSFLFSCFFGSAWFSLGKYYNQQAIRQGISGQNRNKSKRSSDKCTLVQ